MSVNKKMHPRNVFKTPPSFNELSLKYPEFKRHVKLGLDGKLTIDFSDIEALRALSKILLLHYFQIEINIPNNTLVPTIPLRLNYILWLQDLAEFLQIDDKDVHVIDIGAGATCIYGLLMNKLRKWKVLALESDYGNFQVAKSNVELNQMQDYIQVKESKSENLLTDNIDADIKYTFCMCNPPFFDENSQDTAALASKKGKLPKNASTGKVNELSFPGGEVAFIEKLIEESKILKDKIQIYTTMIGHKKNVKLLKGKLKSYEICNFIESEFCQGNTTRWALAWTFLPIDIKNSTCNKHKNHKKNEKNVQTLSYELTTEQNLHSLFTRLQVILKDMKLIYEILYLSDMLGELKVSAVEDTWSHARRRRREAASKEKFLNHMNNLNSEIDFLNDFLVKNITNDQITCLAKIEDSILKTHSEVKLLHENEFIRKNNELFSKLLSIEKTFIGQLTSLKKYLSLEKRLDNCDRVMNQINMVLNENNTQKRKYFENDETEVKAEIDCNSSKKFKLQENEMNVSNFERSKSSEKKLTNFIIQFTILLHKIPNEQKIKFVFLKNKDNQDSNILCQIYSYIINQLK